MKTLIVYFSAERRFYERYRDLTEYIISVSVEYCVRFNGNLDNKIASRASVRTYVSLTSYGKLLTVVYTRGDIYF